MKNKNKNAIPEKMSGSLRIGGKDVAVGSVSGGNNSSNDLKKAINKLIKKRIFPLPNYLNE